MNKEWSRILMTGATLGGLFGGQSVVRASSITSESGLGFSSPTPLTEQVLVLANQETITGTISLELPVVENEIEIPDRFIAPDNLIKVTHDKPVNFREDQSTTSAIVASLAPGAILKQQELTDAKPVGDGFVEPWEKAVLLLNNGVTTTQRITGFVAGDFTSPLGDISNEASARLLLGEALYSMLVAEGQIRTEKIKIPEAGDPIDPLNLTSFFINIGGAEVLYQEYIVRLWNINPETLATEQTPEGSVPSVIEDAREHPETAMQMLISQALGIRAVTIAEGRIPTDTVYIETFNSPITDTESIPTSINLSIIPTKENGDLVIAGRDGDNLIAVRSYKDKEGIEHLSTVSLSPAAVYSLLAENEEELQRVYTTATYFSSAPFLSNVIDDISKELYLQKLDMFTKPVTAEQYAKAGIPDTYLQYNFNESETYEATTTIKETTHTWEFQNGEWIYQEPSFSWNVTFGQPSENGLQHQTSMSMAAEPPLTANLGEFYIGKDPVITTLNLNRTDIYTSYDGDLQNEFAPMGFALAIGDSEVALAQIAWFASGCFPGPTAELKWDEDSAETEIIVNNTTPDVLTVQGDTDSNNGITLAANGSYIDTVGAIGSLQLNSANGKCLIMKWNLDELPD